MSSTLLPLPLSPRTVAHEPGLAGDDHELGAVACVQFGEEGADVGLDRGQAQVELFRDLCVGQAVGDQAEHLQFAVGDGVQRPARRSRRFRAAGELRDQASGHRGREQCVARSHEADGGEDLGRQGCPSAGSARRPARRAV